MARSPTFVEKDRPQEAAVRAELLHGLQATPAVVSPKYLYDALGSRLFAAITELPEYYLTRTEASIFAREIDAMADELPAGLTLVDLGAGNCEKAARLLGPLRISTYVAVDISVDFLRDALERLQQHHPEVDMLGVGSDFSSRLVLPAAVGDGARLLFYPGSSIGNFTPAQALDFLRQMHPAAQGGGLLIGVDLRKPVEVLEAAYDDPLRITAAFNRNLLRHVNQLVGSDFVLADWRHRAFFNSAQSRIEMHLEALRSVTVRWPGAERAFAAGERIHTENSYKWRADDFAALLVDAGFSAIRRWTDERGWFAVFLARV
ncbi:MAG: L-histidine N(alpha)-methyltransferase [Candidatus Accumulibacter sp.]|uniref:L-histidine N(alpha)-methyltransferase n=1 Tax=Accumulibacter sp. TaxID=2053492 RepID=UPI001E0C76DA|nr:L-histidine N(alpha)-methyltransferase [Accumulibacter sp.]MCB1942980.1 L-histidine N(alpha)-methyltransferase [Accumulibacter sp.]MCP5248953.1 L-histidine N(alpha)-methyltransferase [Accumulibacter sp.]